MYSTLTLQQSGDDRIGPAPTDSAEAWNLSNLTQGYGALPSQLVYGTEKHNSYVTNSPDYTPHFFLRST